VAGFHWTRSSRPPARAAADSLGALNRLVLTTRPRSRCELLQWRSLAISFERRFSCELPCARSDRKRPWPAGAHRRCHRLSPSQIH
jgi:hypothetical protein